MAESLKSLARQGHMVISGQNGQQLMDFYNSALDKISKR